MASRPFLKLSGFLRCLNLRRGRDRRVGGVEVEALPSPSPSSVSPTQAGLRGHRRLPPRLFDRKGRARVLLAFTKIVRVEPVSVVSRRVISAHLSVRRGRAHGRPARPAGGRHG